MKCPSITPFGGPRNRRHDILVRSIAGLQRRAYLMPVVELSIAGTNYKSRPDIVAVGLNGGTDLFEVTVIAVEGAYKTKVNNIKNERESRL